MITPQEKSRIIAMLGKQYSKSILQHFAKLQITNADGREYSNASIRMFVCGERENLPVELAILKLVKTTERKKIAMELEREKLIA